MRPLPLFVAVAALLPLEAAAQGLGDAASREQQRRKAAPSQPARAITQEQLDAASAARAAWISPDGTFRVAFPGEPEVRDEAASGQGTTYRTRSSTNTFSVNVRNQPLSASMDALVGEMRDTALRSLGEATVGGERPVATPRGVSGRELVITFTGRRTGRQGVMRTRLHLSGGRSYLVTVAAEAGGDNAPELMAFLDSFEILREGK